ncbi:hypothetical protein AB0C77_33540 [Streptomyces sp. NPDC048629]|uniref:ATP-grasp domain-containing protein n=1 Tax=Streptomyces sp. NPDC048629 TaxID=3154824 RepID=UPI00341619D4
MLTVLLGLVVLSLVGALALGIRREPRADGRHTPTTPQPRSAPPPSEELLIINGEAFVNGPHGESAFMESGVRTSFCGIDDIVFDIETGHPRVYETSEGRDLADFGLVQVAAYPRPTASLISALCAYLEGRGRPVVNIGHVAVPTKLYQLLRLAQAGVPVPPTVLFPRRLLHGSYEELRERLGHPFVVKALNSSGGRLNYLVRSETEFQLPLLDPTQERTLFVAQSYVPHNGTFRLLVMGGEAPIVMHRCSTDGTHLTNTEQGGHATLFEPDTFDAEARDMALRAAALFGFEIAGVNLVQDRTTGTWQILEVTSNPAIGQGAFAAEKTDAYRAYLSKRLRTQERRTSR